VQDKLNHADVDRISSSEEKRKLALACKGDTLPALLIWLHHNLDGFSSSTNDFCIFLIVITPNMMVLTELLEIDQAFFYNENIKAQ
jgi:hypothetical protein